MKNNRKARPNDNALTIGGHRLVFDGPLTVTRLNKDGKLIRAVPENNQEYRNRSIGTGYGANTKLMSREHEITHALIAKWLKLPESPTMRGVADDKYFSHWGAEEAAVLAIQQLCRRLEISIEELAKEWKDE